eukprot:Seg1481.7 transcript_id=Seg1481.7/GoldUCD/mRNA.D3Y31 product="hypothetical protein" protein_id=Seg1481.7/GoldUCD/D3Y31
MISCLLENEVKTKRTNIWPKATKRQEISCQGEEEVKTKRTNIWPKAMKQEVIHAKVNKRSDSVPDPNGQLQAVGVRPEDLAKHGFSFYIHCFSPDAYVRYSTSKIYNGYVMTKPGYKPVESSTKTLFSLEDAGSPNTYYIKAKDFSNLDVGYLYMSDKRTGFHGIPGWERHNNIMWSADKKDELKYKFEFLERDNRLGSYFIRCLAKKYLMVTTGSMRYVKATSEAPVKGGGDFELVMPVSIFYFQTILSFIENLFMT